MSTQTDDNSGDEDYNPPDVEPRIGRLDRDPEKLPSLVRWLYYIGLYTLVLVAIVITGAGTYAATVWLTNAGVKNGDLIHILVIIFLVVPTVLIFYCGKALIDRLIFGPLPKRQKVTPDPSVTRPTIPAELFTADSIAPARPGSKGLLLIFVPIVIIAGAIFLWQTLLHPVTYETRKARMEAEVVKLLEKEGIQQPLKPVVELTEGEQGEWKGTAKYGTITYRLKARLAGERLALEFQRIK